MDPDYKVPGCAISNSVNSTQRAVGMRHSLMNQTNVLWEGTSYLSPLRNDKNYMAFWDDLCFGA